MARNAFFCSDHHFHHTNILEYATRPFDSVEEMNETIIKRHNEVVGEFDRVYFMGDVAIAKRGIELVGRMNGKKVLIKGNHDIFKLKDYLPYFDDIRSYKHYPTQGIIVSHIPVHTSQLEYRFKWNIHGHTHEKNIMNPNLMEDFWSGDMSKFPIPLYDPRYINVCLEQTNYTPISLEDICQKLQISS